MSMNRIQFQPGLSMPEFLKCYGTQAQCAAALEQARWPAGFRCPRCDGAVYSRVRGRPHALFQC
ncbi:Transposase zinc-ribbon domain-containing protein, partial [Azotobacter beijerinckii]